MNFTDALQALVAGKYVMRSSWGKDGTYLILLPGINYIWRIYGTAQNWMPLVADLQADDWQIME